MLRSREIQTHSQVSSVMVKQQFSLFFASQITQAPQALEASLAGCLNSTFSPEHLEILVHIPENDPESTQKQEIVRNLTHEKTRRTPIILITKLEKEHQTFNKLYEVAKGTTFINIPLDAQILSFGWDRQITHAMKYYEQGIFCFELNSQLSRARPAVIALPKLWADAVRYYYVPMFSGPLCLQWLSDMAQRLGVYQYLPDLLLRCPQEDGGGQEKRYNESEKEYFRAFRDLRIRDCKLIAMHYFSEEYNSTLDLPGFWDLKINA
ncbi:MAG: hypothetical protein AAF352_01945 [Pseudomonadota bacterium]